MSLDALDFARQLAAGRHTRPDDRVAVAELLERWQIGLGLSLTERRIALRASREQQALSIELGQRAPVEEPQVQVLEGDDDVADIHDLADEAPGVFDEEAFYADALEDL